MYYTRLLVICKPDFVEILIAEIAETGFNTFQETDSGFEAFVDEDSFDMDLIESIQQKYSHVNPLSFEFTRVEKENWNEQWEKSFEPVIVNDQCIVRADFHNSEKKYPYEIIITPKMSFGTGHHATTWLMLKYQLEINQENKRIMDAGCGTCILSIMAEKRGANFIDAFDIDEWSKLNGQENIENNNCGQIRLRQGTIRTLDFDTHFDIILANINKNILLDEMVEYARYLKSGGMLLISGFFTTDIDDLVQCAESVGLIKESEQQKENWCASIFRKI